MIAQILGGQAATFNQFPVYAIGAKVRMVTSNLLESVRDVKSISPVLVFPDVFSFVRLPICLGSSLHSTDGDASYLA